MNKSKMIERLVFSSVNNTDLGFNINILPPEANVNGTCLDLNLHLQSSKCNNSLLIDPPSSMDNAIVWTIFCDVFGAPCMLAFLYVLYRGIEVL